MLDEEMEKMSVGKKSFRCDSDLEDEVTDADMKKILIVTQVRL